MVMIVGFLDHRPDAVQDKNRRSPYPLGTTTIPPGMLASGALDTGAALEPDAFSSALVHSNAALLTVFFHIANSGLIRNGADSTCFEHVVLAE